MVTPKKRSARGYDRFENFNPYLKENLKRVLICN